MKTSLPNFGAQDRIRGFSTKSLTYGFTLIELLVVVAIIGILLTVGVAALFSARVEAQKSTAQAYAANVYKVAFAYITESPNNSVLEDTDCTESYSAGNSSTNSSSSVTDCTVVADANGLPLVQVVAIDGSVFTVP